MKYIKYPVVQFIDGHIKIIIQIKITSKISIFKISRDIEFLMKLFLSLKIILHLKIDLKICQNYLIQARSIFFPDIGNK